MAKRSKLDRCSHKGCRKRSEVWSPETGDLCLKHAGMVACHNCGHGVFPVVGAPRGTRYLCSHCEPKDLSLARF